MRTPGRVALSINFNTGREGGKGGDGGTKLS